jgi:serine/threonine-protein kinase
VQVGSPPYQAPETATSNVASDLSDVYGLGALAYELVCGIRAIHIKDTSPEAYSAYLKSNQPIPTYRIATIMPSIPEAVETVIHRALSREPGARFRAVTEFRSALLEAAGEPPPTGEPPPVLPVGGGTPIGQISGAIRRLLPFRKT